MYLSGIGSEGRAHNAYLTVWIEMGIGGLALLLAVVCQIVFEGLSLYRQPRVSVAWRAAAGADVRHLSRQFRFAHAVLGKVADHFDFPGCRAGRHLRKKIVCACPARSARAWFGISSSTFLKRGFRRSKKSQSASPCFMVGKAGIRICKSKENVSVTVIVPCRNEIRHIRDFLDSVIRQDTTGIDLEIVVADGMSGDGTREILEEYERECPTLRVIDNPKRIVSTGLNAAIRQARGEIIVRMDAHTEYAPDYIRTCVQVMNETNAENVGGPALTRAEGYLAQAIARGFHSKFVSGGARFHDARYEGYVDTVTYGCWRKSTLLRMGLFDERLYRSQD